MQNRRILLLGAPRLEVNGSAAHLERRKSMALLAYLATINEGVTREALAAMFWPDYESSRAAAYLRNTLWTISKVLGDDWVLAEQDTVRFNPDAGIERDVYQFQSLINNAQWIAISDVESHRQRAALLSEATLLYRAEFMAGFTLRDSPDFDNWMMFTAENLRQQSGEALDRLMECFIQLGEYENGIAVARRRITLDPLYESAHRQLMRLYAWTGQVPAALRQYREVVRLFQSELGSVPDAETRALHEAITTNKLPTPQPITAAPNPAVRPEQTPAPSNLPASTTPFIGRGAELIDLARLINEPTCRLVTIVGPGGIGKTRLAIETGRTAYEGEVYYVSLSPITNVDFIFPTIAAAVDFCSIRPEDNRTQLLEYLHGRRMLLIIDNFEHLIEHAELLSDLLTHAPEITLLVTSRERLNLQEEHLYEIGGLSIPTLDAIDHLEEYGAVALFLQATQRVHPGYVLTPMDAPAVIRICQAVEGMPLGIELAASWMQVLSCHEIANEIDNSLDFLTTTARNVPERHRSLRAVFERSWEYLTRDEQACLSKLSIFRGGFSVGAAQFITGASLTLLLALSNKSLIRRSGRRFELHELIRQYAEQKLDQDERVQTLSKHSAYYCRFLAQREAQLKGRDSVFALDEIEQDRDNVRLAWEYAVEQHQVAMLQEAFEALVLFSSVRMGLHGAHKLIVQAIDQLSQHSDDPATRLLLGGLLAMRALALEMNARAAQVAATVQSSLAYLREFKGHRATALPLVMLADLLNIPGKPADVALELIEEAIAIYTANGDQWGIAHSTFQLGMISHTHLQYEKAERCFNDSLQLFQKIGHVWGMGIAQSGLAQQRYTLGDYQEAQRLIQESMRLFEQAGDQRRVAIFFNALWQNYAEEGYLERLGRQLKMFEEIGDVRAIAWTHYDLAWIAWLADNFDEALPLLTQAYNGFRDTQTHDGMAWARIYLADIALQQGDPAEASLLALEALEIVENMDLPWCVSGALYVLGDVALAQGNLDQARRKYTDAVRIAHQTRAAMQIMRHLGGYAEYLLRAEEPHAALAMITFLLEHPATWKDTNKRLNRLVVTLRGMLPRVDYAIAQTQGRTLTLEGVIDSVINGKPLPISLSLPDTST